MANQVDDTTVIKALRSYVSVADRIVRDPGTWLGEHAPDSPGAGNGSRLSSLRDRLRGDMSPAHPEWPNQTLSDRVDWWVKRITLVAGPIAAAPRVAGALSKHIPMQGALGASAAGLAVCAVAKEHAVDDKDEWIALLGKILFDRTLQAATIAAVRGDDSSATGDPAPDEIPVKSIGGKSILKLAQTFRSVQSLFDDRPRGSLISRGIGKVPVVGVAGGYLDERGAISKAAKQTTALLRKQGAARS